MVNKALERIYSVDVEDIRVAVLNYLKDVHDQPITENASFEFIIEKEGGVVGVQVRDFQPPTKLK